MFFFQAEISGVFNLESWAMSILIWIDLKTYILSKSTQSTSIHSVLFFYFLVQWSCCKKYWAKKNNVFLVIWPIHLKQDGGWCTVAVPAIQFNSVVEDESFCSIVRFHYFWRFHLFVCSFNTTSYFYSYIVYIVFRSIYLISADIAESIKMKE